MGSHDTYGTYDAWARNYDSLSQASRHLIQRDIQALSWRPFFSFVLMPPTTCSEVDVYEAIKSLEQQIYSDWELWVPACFSSERISKNKQVCFIKSKDDGRIDLSHIFSAAIDVASGDYILPLPLGAVVRPHALYELAKAANTYNGAVVIYTDEDRIASDGSRFSPDFKTGWDPELALAKNSIGLLASFQRKLFQAGWDSRLLSDNPSLAIYEISLYAAFATEAQNIHHIPQVLCHTEDRVGREPSWDAEGARNIVRRHLKWHNIPARVVSAPLAPEFNLIVRTAPDSAPLVSIIIPTRDRVDFLERCVSSILANTSYSRFEILIVDNDSSEPETLAFFERMKEIPAVQVLENGGQFNYSRLNNFAAQNASGDILILLNNDTATINPNWLSELVAQAVRPDVGAVGAKLLYENGQVQHAGIIFQPGIGPVHQFRLSSRFDPGPGDFLALTRSVMIVTGACLAIRKALYIEAGGLDEQLAVAYNDVDLCMRLGDMGYRIIWTPTAELFHFEGMSRGQDDTPEKQALVSKEIAYFSRRWGSLLQSDPFRNANLDYHWDRVTLSRPPARSYINS